MKKRNAGKKKRIIDLLCIVNNNIKLIKMENEQQ